jgi:Flp pilus assembly protein TadD
LARVLVDQGKFQEALAILDEVAARRRRAVDDYPANQRHRHDLAAAVNDRGLVLVRLRRLDEGIASFRQASELKPSEDAYLANLAQALHLKGDRPAAIAALRKAIEAAPMRAPQRADYEKLLKEWESQP